MFDPAWILAFNFPKVTVIQLAKSCPLLKMDYDPHNYFKALKVFTTSAFLAEAPLNNIGTGSLSHMNAYEKSLPL